MVEDLKTIDTLDLSPFKKLVMTIGELPTSFVESMTYYEALAWLVNYLENQVIPTVNNNAEAVEELQAAFVTLKNYVDNYFDNLDVQEEINNKLDEMAEAGELSEIITDYLNDSLKVIFPTYGVDGTDTLGDCSIIKTTNKSIMIDCFADNADCWAKIAEALYQNNISALDYFIVSHFDGDHYGNYQRLIASGLIDDATIILPPAVVNDYINKTGNDIKQALTTAGLSYTEATNTTLNIDDNVTLRMFNVSSDDYAYYDSLGDISYNNYSLCCEVKINDKKILFAGDCEKIGCDYIANHYINESGYELIKDLHHGFAGYSNEFVHKTTPNYVVIPASVGMINKNLGYRGEMSPAWGLITPNIYVQGIQSEPIVFKIGIGETIIVSDSVSNQEVGANGQWDYVVDSTTTSALRLGTTEHPFKSLAEASFLLPKNSKMNLNIQVVNLGNETVDVYFTGFHRIHINFQNNVPDNNIRFISCDQVSLTGIKLETTQIRFEDCHEVIIGSFNSSAAVSRQLIFYRCNVLFNNTITSTNATECVIYAPNSTIHFDITDLSYTQNSASARIINAYNTVFTFSELATTKFHVYKFLSEIANKTEVKQCVYSNVNALSTLYSGSATENEIIPFENQKLYDKLLVLFITSDNRRTSQIVRSNNNDSVFISTPSSDGTELYTVSAIIDSYTANSISFSRNKGVNITTSGNSTSSTTLRITSVIGLID